MSPLAGLRVVLTRATHQADEMATAFRAAGARVAQLPLLAVLPPADPRPLERAATELALFHWLVFTSANAVEAFLPAAGGTLPPSPRVAAVGPATARALAAHGIAVALEAPRGDAESLVEALAPHLGRQQRVLVPQAIDARPTLARGLIEAGAEVVVVVAYDKGMPPEARQQARELFASEPLGWVTFTSPRIVRHFLEVLGEVLGAAWPRRRGELLAASIGPVTSRELRDQGIEPAAEAAMPGAEALVAAVVATVVARKVAGENAGEGSGGAGGAGPLSPP